MTITELIEATDRLETWASIQRPPLTPTWNLFDGIKRADDLIAELDAHHRGAPGAAQLRARLTEVRGWLVRAAL